MRSLKQELLHPLFAIYAGQVLLWGCRQQGQHDVISEVNLGLCRGTPRDLTLRGSEMVLFWIDVWNWRGIGQSNCLQERSTWTAARTVLRLLWEVHPLVCNVAYAGFKRWKIPETMSASYSACPVNQNYFQFPHSTNKKIGEFGIIQCLYPWFGQGVTETRR